MIKSEKILRYAKKYKSIEMLGGKCEKCGENRFFRLVFHHVNDNKEDTICRLKFYRWDILKKEVSKCKLLCKNCHTELHSTNIDTIYKKSKSIYLDYKDTNECKLCGYNKCNDALTFHHINGDDKIIKLSMCRTSSISKLKKNINDELNKCDVLCQNCHNELHSDLDFFDKNKKDIIKKSKNLRKMTKKIDRNIVKKMYFTEKLKQKDIVKHFNCSKSTISGIIKELKNS